MEGDDTVEFGLFLSTFGEGASVETFRTVSRNADEAGYVAIWVGDHVALPEEIPDTYPFSETGEAPFHISQDVYDPFQVLSYVAAVTGEIDLGTNTAIVPYRHPVLLAKQALTLQKLQGGRFDFGVAPGWMRTEFELLDVPFEDRGPRTDEFLEFFQRICEQPESSFEGPFHTLRKAGYYPSPEECPRIWIGGGSGASFRRVGQFGDGWTIFDATPGEIKEARQPIQEAWTRYDRDGTPEIAVSLQAWVGGDQTEASDRNLIGDVGSISNRLEALGEAGVTRILPYFLTENPGEHVNQLRAFAETFF